MTPLAISLAFSIQAKTHQKVNNKVGRIEPKGRDLMYRPGFWTIIALALALALTVLTIGVAGVPEDPPATGDWVIHGQKEFEGKTGFVEGSLRITPQSILEITDSVLVINISMLVEGDATITIQNSTIKFNCSLTKGNMMEVYDRGTCSILDNDMDPTTGDDASVITSTNDLAFNVTIFKQAIFTMRNSIVSKCGMPSVGQAGRGGFLLRADQSSISGCSFSDGYYGLIIENAQRVTIDNTTIKDCHMGISMAGSRDVTLQHVTITNCTEYGIEMRGFVGNAIMDSMKVSGCGLANLYAAYLGGFNNQVINCTIGPGDLVGIYLEEVTDFQFRSCKITGCDTGVMVIGGNLQMVDMNVTDCPTGMSVTDQATLMLRDLNLADTTLEVERGTDTNISVKGGMSWERVTANLTCDLVAQSGTTINIQESHLSFRNSTDGANGLWSLWGGTITMTDCIIDSPEDHSLLCQLLDGSRSIFTDCHFLDMGTSTGGVSKTGMWAGGTGTIKECTISDSMAGLVIGKSQTNILNLTIRDCLTGIIADGNLGRGGGSIGGLHLSGCDVAVRAVNDGAINIINGWLQLAGEGFNITTANVYIKDTWVSAPGAGERTATLRETAILDIINSSTSRDFDIGPNFNIVNIYWYLNLTLRHLSDGSPLSDALVTVRESSGTISHIDEPGGADGVLKELELRERVYNPDLVVTTPHTITVTKGDLSDSFTITVDTSIDHLFLLDNYPPVLLVQQPENGSLHFVSNITFEGEAWDAVVTATEGLASMRYRVDGSNWTAINLPEVTGWSFDAFLEDGFHLIEIQVRDRIGNLNHTSVTVEVNTKAPKLTITSPEDGILINYTDVTVVGVADPNSTVTVDGEVVELDAEGGFNRTLTLEQGVNVIVIVTTDSVGKETVVTRTVAVDILIPEVEFDQEDLRTNQLTFTLSGTKKTNASLYINGLLPEFFGSTEFEVEMDLPVEGLNDVDVWSADLAGNNWSTTLLIDRDTTPPELTVGQLPEFTNKATLTVQGSVDDPDAIVTVNGAEVVLSGTTFAHTVSLAEGENTITVEAMDDVDNAAVPVVQVVTLSTTPPNLVISTAKFVETLEFTQELAGETDPSLPVSVLVVLGPYSKTYSARADASGVFTVDIELPQVGNHSVTVTVSNEAGNQVSDQLFFVRLRQDPVKPPEPEETPWLEENWAYVILIAAIVASAAIWMFTLSAGKRKKQQMAAQRTALPRPQEEADELEAGEEAEADEAQEVEEETEDQEVEAEADDADEEVGADEWDEDVEAFGSPEDTDGEVEELWEAEEQEEDGDRD